MTDADVFLRGDSIELLIQPLQNKSVGAVCARQFLIKEFSKDPNRLEPQILTNRWEIYQKIHHWLKLFEMRIDSTAHFHGQLMAWKRNINIRFDPAMSSEDVDFAIRIRKAGFKVVYNPEAFWFELIQPDIGNKFLQHLRRAEGVRKCFGAI